VHCVIETNDSTFSHYWEKLYANDPLQNPLYAQQSYECHDLINEQGHFTDRSFLVVFEDEPVFGCSLTMHTDDQGRKCMGYFGMEASTHVNRASMQQASNNFQPEAIRLLQQHIYHLIEEIQPDSLHYLDPVSCGIMSPVTQVLLEKGAIPILQKAQVIDLTPSAHSLIRNMKKSHRSFINWGRRHLSIDVISGQGFDSEKSAHLQAMHQETISLGNSPFSSWRVYEQLIRQGNAFLVQGNYMGELTASTLFLHTEKTCHYVFGDTSHDSPDRPVLHALIWKAMMHSRALGCSQFHLGNRSATNAEDSADEKLVTGFGGEARTQLKVSLIY